MKIFNIHRMNIRVFVIMFFFQIICSSIKVFSQDLPALSHFPQKDGSIYYEREIYIDSLSKEKLYQRARLCAISSNNFEKGETQVNDPEAGLLVFTGYFNKPMDGYKPRGVAIVDNRQVWATHRIEISGSRVRIVIHGIKIRSNVNSSITMRHQDSGLSEFWQIENFDSIYSSKKSIFRKIRAANQDYFIDLNRDFEKRLVTIIQIMQSP